MKKNDVYTFLDLYISIVIFILMWILYGGNYWNGDRDGYELYYQRSDISSWGIEVGYGYLNILFNKLGVSYQEYQVIISFTTLLLIINYFRKTSYSISVSVFAYFILMFTLDYVLMRTTLSYAIILNAFYYLYKEKRVKYIILIIIAMLFHQSAVFFLIFVLLPRKIKSLNIMKYALISIFIILLSMYVKNMGIIPEKILYHINYYSTTIKSTSFNVLINILSIFLIYLNMKSIIRSKCCHESYKYTIFIYNVNVLSIMIFFLYFHADIFVRIFRLLVFINIIYFIQLAVVRRKTNYYAMLYLFIFCIYLIGYYIYPTTEYSFYPMIKYNLIINVDDF